jgi:hypothetical protein
LPAYQSIRNTYSPGDSSHAGKRQQTKRRAEKSFFQGMETFKRVLGEEHPSTLTSMANLASTYRNQGRWKEAEELEVQVMETLALLAPVRVKLRGPID